MKNDWMKLLGATTLAMSLLAFAPAMADESYSDWDTDKNAALDNDEFANKFDSDGIYNSWDSNENGGLSQDEFNNGVFGSYDKNKNNIIEESEFGDLNDDMGENGLFDV
ncbi:MAG TPA: hypothetical protein VHL31_21270 [Geminicoccus sp.]|jgi:hypothetical protein|uniref:hypothetical protein n=1 Tax=Geminicoccus sp. TaxID=2024832 RepID=UPI002E37DDA7|nr:hypothetical protein [Geminicoccus sp.]HEX2528810.1 hypothetical protein [Geminicoccus sp.]